MKRQRGISIIEIAVTLTVLSLLLALGVPAFQEWVVNTRVRTASDAFLNGLQVARAEAIRRNRAVAFRLVGTDGGWQVVSAPAAGACPVADPTADDVLQTRDAIEGGAGVSVTVTPATNTQLIFTPMGLLRSDQQCGDPTIQTQTGQTQFELSSTQMATARRLRVVVGPTGGMRMCEVSRPTGDPRACQ